MAYDTAIVLGFAAISGVMAYLAMNVDRKTHGILQIFFISLSLLAQWGTLGTIRFILDKQSITEIDPLINNFLIVWIWAFALFVLYVLITFFYNLIAKRRGRKDGLVGYRGQQREMRTGGF